MGREGARRLHPVPRFLSFGEDITQPYVRALEARGVPHVLVGGKSFHNREEIETIRAALSAVEWPDDELSVFAALRGALFAVGDEELLEWRHRFGGFHPFRIPEGFRLPADGVQLPASGSQVPASGLPHLQPIADALRVLQTLHRRRNYRPVAETVQDLLDTTRAHVGIVLRTAGEQALANVLHIAELAREYESSGGLSFRGFVDELRVAAETAQASEAPILEDASDGVRLMTVHKAKGLEFPVVILADLTCKLARAEAGRWLDPDRRVCALKLGGWAPIDLLLHDAEEGARDRAEAERLAYVAATRAKDLLVVPAIGDGSYERLARSDHAGAVSARNRAPLADAGPRRAALQIEGHRPASSRRRSRNAADRRARHVRVQGPGPQARHVSRDVVGSTRTPPGRRVVVRPSPRRSDRQATCSPSRSGWPITSAGVTRKRPRWRAPRRRPSA
jgi:ATP-dependent exoDNAse (exonuclease V) beta subunit